MTRSQLGNCSSVSCFLQTIARVLSYFRDFISPYTTSIFRIQHHRYLHYANFTHPICILPPFKTRSLNFHISDATWSRTFMNSTNSSLPGWVERVAMRCVLVVPFNAPTILMIQISDGKYTTMRSYLEVIQSHDKKNPFIQLHLHKPP